MRIEIVVFDGFDEIDVFGPFEVLASAGFDVELVGVVGPGQVISQRAVKLNVQAGLGTPDGVVVPGGGWGNRAAEGAWTQAQQGTLATKLNKAAESADWIASVCSGGMLLATAGLLAGRTATTNRNAFDEFRPLVGTLIDERVVDDGDRITSGALTSGLDLGLWIVERELGTEIADRVRSGLEYPGQGRVWRAPRSIRRT